MHLSRRFDVEGAILRVCCIVLLLPCLAKADDASFEDDDTRRGLGALTAPHTTGFKVFDVSKCPGARGDGKTDVTPAVQKAWMDVCNSPTPAKLMFPIGTWLTAALDFHGPCIAPQIIIEIKGTLQAKPDCQAFPKGTWINVINVNQVTINGGGTIHAQGEKVWRTRVVGEKGTALPDTLVLAFSNNSEISNIHMINSKGFNMKIFNTNNVNVHNVHIVAPDESPNTDGIHVGRLQNIKIFDSFIGVGDDCISIGDGSWGVTVSNVTCGPGHGISIGSLGRYQDEQDVRNIVVNNCTLVKTQNGARIKTMRNSPAIQATNITFSNIIMRDVYNPIIIDQNYFAQKNSVASKVKLSNIRFKNIQGTSWSNVAVSLNCSEAAPCEAVELADIDFKYTGTNTLNTSIVSACWHTKAKFSGRLNPPGCKM